MPDTEKENFLQAVENWDAYKSNSCELYSMSTAEQESSVNLYIVEKSSSLYSLYAGLISSLDNSYSPARDLENHNGEFINEYLISTLNSYISILGIELGLYTSYTKDKIQKLFSELIVKWNRSYETL
ncbi:hypothetical protein [Taylorella equigenitalis]|uniref:hypothetical protein n=1 Tax=Taylorella equigenitalis TaxID=29575 RepID=UPI0005D2B240|nr:hypothetical protein [Taylorella equigenitalis]WDU56327.1 hypothetical protein KPH58_07745 [Taylorella equigenitalis]